jgi:hypothetical protein
LLFLEYACAGEHAHDAIERGRVCTCLPSDLLNGHWCRVHVVSDATGQQGGAVARALLSRGHRVKALTRMQDSDAARQLMSAGADLVTGDLGKAASVLKAASGVGTMFLMGNSYEAGAEEETRQAIIAAEAAKAAGVGHLIYSSVADANKKTGIPHFESKYHQRAGRLHGEHRRAVVDRSATPGDARLRDASPAAKERRLPNRRTRSISSESSVGTTVR